MKQEPQNPARVYVILEFEDRNLHHTTKLSLCKYMKLICRNAASACVLVLLQPLSVSFDGLRGVTRKSRSSTCM
jgi:hypothetical protein